MLQLTDIGTGLIHQDDSVRIWDLVLEPGQVGHWHDHRHPYMFVVAAEGTVILESQDGQVERQEADPLGTVIHRRASQTHRLTNVGDSTYRNLILEFIGVTVSRRSSWGVMDDIGMSTSLLAGNPDMWLVGFLKHAVAGTPAADALAATLDDNPGRISRAYDEALGGYRQNPSDILKKVQDVEPRGQGVIVCSRRTPFLSWCAHHFLPFWGEVSMVVEPGPAFTGIGKFPRLVQCRARRFQMQENLVRDLCTDIMDYTQARGAYVRSVARHSCVCYRGPSGFPTETVTQFASGSLSDAARIPEVMLALDAP